MSRYNKNFLTPKNIKGFTLIELLVVIGILAILLAVTLIAINPARQFQQANDTQRKADVLAILNAINQFSVDEQGRLPGEGLGPLGGDMITSTPQNISSTQANLCAFLVTRYMAALPVDPVLVVGNQTSIPDCGIVGGYDTGYVVSKSADGRIVVGAPEAQLAPLIEVTR